MHKKTDETSTFNDLPFLVMDNRSVYQLVCHCFDINNDTMSDCGTAELSLKCAE